MNRKLIATLLHKNVEELAMLAANFMEDENVSASIIGLAKRKTEDIQTLLAEYEIASIKSNDTPPTIVQETPKAGIIETVKTPEPIANTELPEAVITEPEPAVFLADTPTIDSIDPEPEVEPEPEIVLNIEDFELEITNEKSIQTFENTTSEIHTELSTSKSTETTIQHTQTKKLTIAETIGTHSTSRNESLQSKDQSLNSTITGAKVSDIKQAISIGDRFRFQRELFRSNGEDMNKTLTYLNLLQTYNEAVSFLKSKYNWDESNEAVEDFYKIMKRKFVN